MFEDVRDAFNQFSSLPGYDYKAMKEEELKDKFDLTWNEDGSYNIHPKGMHKIDCVDMPEGWIPWRS